ncbi:MAG TPA: hypothetical protein VN669_08000 [Candidatus Acidoferrales bacterium]|jgi:hypothetical protein|nr:hypothetical protein [Candidatus Acidoferrales bacterium]
MKSIRTFCLLVLASGMALGQASQPNNSNVADDLKTLRDAIAAQQKQIAEQQKKLEELQQQLNAKAAAPAPHVQNATLTTTAPATNVSMVQADTEKPKESPLSIRIGGTEFTPGGFVDFNNIFRTTNTQNAVSTTFGGIPFSNTPQGQLTEFRSSGQYSRFNLKVSGKYGENKIGGYIEADFNGNDAANVFVTTNPHTFRLRLYYLQLGRGNWEFTLGQAWGLLTPNKVGVGASPSDLDTTMATDGNIMTGVMYSRDAQFRIAYKPSDHFGWALSVANPQQIAPGVAFPAFLGAGFANTVDGNANAGVPNLFPDVSTKIAIDTNPTGRNKHLEIGGVLTSAQIAVPRPGVVGAFDKESAIGGGVFGGVGISLTKKFRVVAHGMYGNGDGRYFIGSGPQFVVVPIAIAPTVFTAEPSLVHAGSGFGGAEWQATSSTQIGAYYGGIYYARNAFTDITATTPVQPIIGYGGVGSANNRAIQQGELVIAHTMWKNPQYGAFVVASDSSYVTRALWAHLATAPKNAHMFMTKIDFKYVLP